MRALLVLFFIFEGCVCVFGLVLGFFHRLHHFATADKNPTKL